VGAQESWPELVFRNDVKQGETLAVDDILNRALQLFAQIGVT
jgi:hypothetical protein